MKSFAWMTSLTIHAAALAAAYVFVSVDQAPPVVETTEEPIAIEMIEERLEGGETAVETTTAGLSPAVTELSDIAMPTVGEPMAPAVAMPELPEPGDVGDAIEMVSKVDEVVAAKPLTEISPKYPRHARRAGEQGVVRVKLTIDAAGSVVAAEVVESCGVTALDQAALTAAKAAKFAAGSINGVARQSELTLTFDFRLK